MSGSNAHTKDPGGGDTLSPAVRSDGAPAADHAQPSEHWSHWVWIATLACGAAAVGLGCAGFQGYAALHSRSESLLNSFYKTLQLFIIHGVELDDPLPWILVFARFLAPVVLGVAALHSFLTATREAARRFGMGFWSGHVVLCGLGHKGLQLLRGFRSAGDRVAVIDRDAPADHLSIARRLGATLLRGDATDPAVLARARVGHCRHLIVITGDDATNVEIAVTAGRVVRGLPATRTDAVQCYVHVKEPEVRRVLRHDPGAFPNSGERFRVAAMGVNPYENAARSVFRRHALDYQSITRRDDPRRIHLLVVGFGQMGESVLLQAARIAHFANGKRLRATVFDLASPAREAELQRRHPFCREVIDVAFVPGDAADPALPARLLAIAEESDSLVTIALCLPVERRNLSLALKLAAAFDRSPSPILVRLDTLRGYGSLFAENHPHRGFAASIHPFATVEQTYTRAMLLHEELDALAKQIHGAFVERRRGQGRRPENDPALLPWSHLADDFKESNRQQADHIPVKVRALGYDEGPPSRQRRRVAAFSKDEIELLAELEHNRWVAERRLAGWTCATPPKSLAKKTSPHLVPWTSLDEAVKQYDRDAVQIIPTLLNAVERWIYRG